MAEYSEYSRLYEFVDQHIDSGDATFEIKVIPDSNGDPYLWIVIEVTFESGDAKHKLLEDIGDNRQPQREHQYTMWQLFMAVVAHETGCIVKPSVTPDWGLLVPNPPSEVVNAL